MLTKVRSAAAKRLDARDLKILEIVQRDGRISKRALAKAVGLSLTPCFQRLQRLERSGFIRGYRGVVDAQRFGPLLWVYTAVTLARHRASDFAAFETFVQNMPDVLECDAVGGGIDYVLKLVARDIAHYQQVIEGLLNSEVGIKTYYTYVVTKRIKEATPVSLGLLMEVSSASRRRRV